MSAAERRQQTVLVNIETWQISIWAFHIAVPVPIMAEQLSLPQMIKNFSRINIRIRFTSQTLKFFLNLNANFCARLQALRRYSGGMWRVHMPAPVRLYDALSILIRPFKLCFLCSWPWHLLHPLQRAM